MIRRHPHVFGVDARTFAGRGQGSLGAIKQDEKAAKRGAGPAQDESILADVPVALPGLTRAVKLQAKASTVGFDWNDVRLVIEKIREETNEIEAALETGETAAIVG